MFLIEDFVNLLLLLSTVYSFYCLSTSLKVPAVCCLTGCSNHFLTGINNSIYRFRITDNLKKRSTYKSTTKVFHCGLVLLSSLSLFSSLSSSNFLHLISFLTCLWVLMIQAHKQASSLSHSSPHPSILLLPSLLTLRGSCLCTLS